MNNNLNLQFDEVFASARWGQALFKLECFHSSKLKEAMKIIAQAAVEDAAGVSIFEMDLSELFAALDFVNDETQTWWNSDEPMTL